MGQFRPSRKSVLSAFSPINRSDCFVSPKSTALKKNTMEFGTPSSILYSPIERPCKDGRCSFQPSSLSLHTGPKISSTTEQQQTLQGSARAPMMLQHSLLVYFKQNTVIFNNAHCSYILGITQVDSFKIIPLKLLVMQQTTVRNDKTPGSIASLLNWLVWLHRIIESRSFHIPYRIQSIITLLPFKPKTILF